MRMSSNMNEASRKNGFHSRIQIVFYSALIWVMSGLNRMRSWLEPKVNNQVQPSRQTIISESNENDVFTLPTKPGIWVRVGQVLTAFIIWMVLGFSAGFLLGMIRLWWPNYEKLILIVLLDLYMLPGNRIFNKHTHFPPFEQQRWCVSKHFSRYKYWANPFDEKRAAQYSPDWRGFYQKWKSIPSSCLVIDLSTNWKLFEFLTRLPQR